MTIDALLYCHTQDAKTIVQKILPALQNRSIIYLINYSDSGSNVVPAHDLSTNFCMVPCLSENFCSFGWSKHLEKLDDETSSAFNRRILPIKLSDLQSEQIPLSLRHLKIPSYSDSSGFNMFLEYLKQRPSRFLNYEMD